MSDRNGFYFNGAVTGDNGLALADAQDRDDNSRLATVNPTFDRETVQNMAALARTDVWMMERKIKRQRAAAKLAEGLAGLMLDDTTITPETTVGELLAKLRA